MLSTADGLYAAFGALVLAHRRRLKGMTQAELGRRIGLSRTSVTNIEQGRHHVSLHQFVSIANALDVMPEALLPYVAREEPRSRMAENPAGGLAKGPCGSGRTGYRTPERIGVRLRPTA